MSNVLSIEEYVKHPKEEGVFLKHFFSNADNDRLNNLDICCKQKMEKVAKRKSIKLQLENP